MMTVFHLIDFTNGSESICLVMFFYSWELFLPWTHYFFINIENTPTGVLLCFCGPTLSSQVSRWSLSLSQVVLDDLEGKFASEVSPHAQYEHTCLGLLQSQWLKTPNCLSLGRKYFTDWHKLILSKLASYLADEVCPLDITHKKYLLINIPKLGRKSHKICEIKCDSKQTRAPRRRHWQQFLD